MAYKHFRKKLERCVYANTYKKLQTTLFCLPTPKSQIQLLHHLQGAAVGSKPRPMSSWIMQCGARTLLGLRTHFLPVAPYQRHAFLGATTSTFSLPQLSLRRALQSDAVAVATDDKYGNKQVISITPRLYDYILTNVREPQILRELREETADMRGSQMQVSPDQAQLLAMLVQIIGAQRCIEVGVFTGYSSLAVALVLPEKGRLVACERDSRALEVAKRYYERAGVLQKVDIKHGLAAETLKSMIDNGESCCYDFAFVDAEKKMYQDYFELLLQLVRAGGIIVIDNVLWHGKVIDPLVNDSKTISIRNFNRNLMEDKRVSISMVPIGDGMTICRKL